MYNTVDAWLPTGMTQLESSVSVESETIHVHVHVHVVDANRYDHAQYTCTVHYVISCHKRRLTSCQCGVHETHSHGSQGNSSAYMYTCIHIHVHVHVHVQYSRRMVTNKYDHQYSTLSCHVN